MVYFYGVSIVTSTLIFSFINLQLMNNLKRPYQVLLNDLISVDFNDHFVKSIDKWQSHSNQYLQSQQSLPHRAFSIFLFNQQNELLLQKRSVQKKTFPLCWTNTCCSHPNMIRFEGDQSTGEQPMRQALHRALIRELGMHIPNQQFYFMEKILYKKEGAGGLNDFGEYQVDYVYLSKLEGEVNFKPVPEQIAQIAWVKQQQFPSFINNILSEGGYLSPWFLKMFESGRVNKWWEMIKASQLKNSLGQNQKKVTNML